MSTPRQTIIALVGLSGAGKSTLTEYFTERGVPKVYMGGIIYEAMREAGIEITPESQQIFREDIRKKEGKDFVIKRAITQLKNLFKSGQHTVVLDGLYSWTEYKILKAAFPGEVLVLAVIAPRHVRHHRLANRQDRPFTQTEANQRDWTEIENLEKGGPIAMADFFIHNDHDIKYLNSQIESTLDRAKIKL